MGGKIGTFSRQNGWNSQWVWSCTLRARPSSAGQVAALSMESADFDPGLLAVRFGKVCPKSRSGITDTGAERVPLAAECIGAPSIKDV